MKYYSISSSLWQYFTDRVYTLSVKYCHSDEENFSLLANMRPNRSVIFCHV